jgi:hypothetical protein
MSERPILQSGEPFERADLQTAVGAVSRLNRISFGRVVAVQLPFRVSPEPLLTSSWRMLGLHALAVNLPLSQADEGSVPIIFR